jgi:hypothetical protein
MKPSAVVSSRAEFCVAQIVEVPSMSAIDQTYNVQVDSGKPVPALPVFPNRPSGEGEPGID